MKTFLNVLVIIIIFLAFFVIPGCGPATHVSVGVGVGVPGAWGPYPGGGVWVGTPVYPPYYYPVNPENDKNREFVWNDISEEENILENSQKKAEEEAEIPYRLSE